MAHQSGRLKCSTKLALGSLTSVLGYTLLFAISSYSKAFYRTCNTTSIQESIQGPEIDNDNSIANTATAAGNLGSGTMVQPDNDPYLSSAWRPELENNLSGCHDVIFGWPQEISIEMPNGSSGVLNGSSNVLNGSSDLLKRSRDLLKRSSDLLNGSSNVQNGSSNVLNGSSDLLNGSSNVQNGSSNVLHLLRKNPTGEIGSMRDNLSRETHIKSSTREREVDTSRETPLSGTTQSQSAACITDSKSTAHHDCKPLHSNLPSQGIKASSTALEHNQLKRSAVVESESECSPPKSAMITHEFQPARQNLVEAGRRMSLFSKQGLRSYITQLKKQQQGAPPKLPKKTEHRMMPMEILLINAVKQHLIKTQPNLDLPNTSSTPIGDQTLSRMIMQYYGPLVTEMKAKLRNEYSALPTEASSWPNFHNYRNQQNCVAELHREHLETVPVKVINVQQYQSTLKFENVPVNAADFFEEKCIRKPMNSARIMDLGSLYIKYAYNKPKRVPLCQLEVLGSHLDIENHSIAEISLRHSQIHRFNALPSNYQCMSPYVNFFAKFHKMKSSSPVDPCLQDLGSDSTSTSNLMFDLAIMLVTIQQMVDEIQDVDYGTLHTNVLNELLETVPKQGSTKSGYRLLTELLGIQRKIVGRHLNPLSLCQEFHCYATAQSFINHMHDGNSLMGQVNLREYAARFITRNCSTEIASRVISLRPQVHPLSDLLLFYNWNHRIIKRMGDTSIRNVYVMQTHSADDLIHKLYQHTVSYKDQWTVFLLDVEADKLSLELAINNSE